MIKFELPFPPSVNHTWMHGKGNRVYSCAKVKDFHKEAMVLINAAKAISNSIEFPIKERLRVIVTLHEKDKRRRDIDNYQKSVLDSCTKNGIWDDDCQIDELIVRRGAMNKEYPHVLIEIMELDNV